MGPPGPGVKVAAGRGVGKEAGLLYALGMLTKVAIILICLVLLFGLGRKKRPGVSNKTTNLLLGLVAALLLLTLITTMLRG